MLLDKTAFFRCKGMAKPGYQNTGPETEGTAGALGMDRGELTAFPEKGPALFCRLQSLHFLAVSVCLFFHF